MAHFAKLDENNIVTRVIVINNDDIKDPETGKEDELLGILFCKKLLGGNWKQTSYTGSFRGNFAGKGFKYMEEYDAFIPPQPYPSWILDTTNFYWVPPIQVPQLTQEQRDIGSEYVWDEDAYQADNTTGWILDSIPE